MSVSWVASVRSCARDFLRSKECSDSVPATGAVRLGSNGVRWKHMNVKTWRIFAERKTHNTSLFERKNRLKKNMKHEKCKKN